MQSSSSADDPPRSSLTERAVLHVQLEPLHAASADLSLLSLLPAIQVAWADGVIQAKERQLILELAEREGLVRDDAAMERLARWLDAPPSEDEVRDSLGELRTAVGSNDPAMLARIVGWARAVARADGGVLGVGAVDSDERRTLEWLDSALDPERGAEEANGVLSRRTRPLDDARAQTLAIMRELLLEGLAAKDDYVDLVPRDVTSMHPRPCPLFGSRMPPAVFGVPAEDYLAFSLKIVTRYVRSLAVGAPGAMRVAARDAVAMVDDRELARLIFETPFSRFLVPALDPRDLELFSAVLPRARAVGVPHKVDFSHLGHLQPLAGVRLAPSVSLFAIDASNRLVPIAIAIGGRVFEPTDGESWSRARAFLLQGCSLSLVAGIHASLHFPMDSVIAVTREMLPVAHPIARLVEAHAYLHLPLDYGVRWNVRSVAWNSQREIYSPFPTNGAGVFRGFSDYYAGIEGNSAYPGYRYPMAPPAFPGPYCAFLRAYYDVVLSFCRRVAGSVSREDARVAAWASALHALLPGFPPADAMRDADVLSRALAGFVHSVSVWHSTEHHVYASEPVRKVPHRLRIDPPVGNEPAVPREQWLHPTDAFRQEMARQMFYEAHTVRALTDVEYGFAEPELAQAADQFFAALRACDRAQPRRFMRLEQMACSIQF